VIGQNAIERFRSRGLRPFRRGSYGHVLGNRDRTGAHQFAIDFHEACVAGLDGAELRMIANVGKLDPGTADHVDEALSFLDVGRGTIN
jgi:hypothetical protein